MIRLCIVGISYEALPLNILTPAPAPDRGGPVACLGGPVACLRWFHCFRCSLCFIVRNKLTVK